MKTISLSLAPGFRQVKARGETILTAFLSLPRLLKQLAALLPPDTGLKPGDNESSFVTSIFGLRTGAGVKRSAESLARPLPFSWINLASPPEDLD